MASTKNQNGVLKKKKKKKVKLLSPFKYVYRKIFLRLLKWLFFVVYKTDKDLINELEKESGNFRSDAVIYSRLEINDIDPADYFNRVKIKTHKDYIKYIRFKIIEGAVFHSPATTISLVVSLLSLLIPFFFIFTSKPSTGLWIQMGCGILLSAISFFSLVPYLKHYVRQLPLTDYAFFIRNVYTESEMISFISYRIWQTCRRFENSAAWLNEKYDHDLGGGETRSVKKFLVGQEEIQGKDKLKKEKHYFPNNRLKENFSYVNAPDTYALRRLEKIKSHFKETEVHKDKNTLNFTINELEKDLQQIAVLMKYCSERLRIPVVELAEHYFQFSTSMYWSWVKKVSHNIDVVLDLLYHAEFPERGKKTHSNDILYDQIKSLLYQIDRFLGRNERFMHYQYQNIAFNDLHDDVIDIGSSSSSSEPIQIYIRLLSRVHSERPIELDQKISNTTIERLLYVYHKRKIHIGLDLHKSAEKILGNINDIMANRSQNILRLEGNYNDLIKVFERVTFRDTLKALQKGESQAYFNFKDLQYLHSDAVLYIDHCRDMMETSFKNKTDVLFNRWMDEIEERIDGKPPKRIYIVTFGYSKAVRQVIKHCIIGEEIRKYSRIVVFSSESESKIDSRQIKYHLTEQPGKRARNVLVSNPDFIIPLLDKNSRILILLGAEVYDDEKNTIRTHAYKSCLVQFLAGASNKMSDAASFKPHSGVLSKKPFIEDEELRKKIKVMICAESYKYYPKLTELVELFDDQYENIEVYDSCLINDKIEEEVKEEIQMVYTDTQDPDTNGTNGKEKPILGIDGVN